MIIIEIGLSSKNSYLSLSEFWVLDHFLDQILVHQGPYSKHFSGDEARKRVCPKEAGGMVPQQQVESMK